MRRFYAWLPPVIWMLLIFVLSSRESVQVSEEEIINFIVFKTLHVFEYGLLFLLNMRALLVTFPKDRRKTIFTTAAAATIVYSLLDEIHQFYVPTREGSMRDVIIDGIGVILAWIFLIHGLPKTPKRLRAWGRHWLKS